jgi:uncharacterized surface anchored protein
MPERALRAWSKYNRQHHGPPHRPHRSCVIAGAKVTVRNLGTGEVRTLTTDASGDFTATLLLPGHYSVTAEHTGFKTSIQNDITLEVDQTVRAERDTEG